MSVSLVSILSIIYVLKIISVSFVRDGLYVFNKDLPAYSILFILSFISTHVIYNFLLLKASLKESIISIYSFSKSSNHFIISLDIIFLFTILIIIFYHTFKITRDSLVK